jgi:hypothetical protein
MGGWSRRPAGVVSVSGSGSQIEIARESGHHVDSRRRYNVIIDGKLVGRLSPGESGRYDVAPGRHALYLKISWARSESHEVDLQPGGLATFTCSPRARGQRSDVDVWQLLSATFLHPRSYVELCLVSRTPPP